MHNQEDIMEEQMEESVDNSKFVKVVVISLVSIIVLLTIIANICS